MELKEVTYEVLATGDKMPSGYYLKTDVDAVLAEKDKEIARLNTEIKEAVNTMKSRDKEIAELKAKLEDAKATAYAESVDAGMRERRLKRALWMARALRARDIQRWCIAATCAPKTERACSVWNNVERKCRAMTEQYK